MEREGERWREREEERAKYFTSGAMRTRAIRIEAD